jgi:hypothetical protein
MPRIRKDEAPGQSGCDGGQPSGTLAACWTRTSCSTPPRVSG